MDFANFWWQKGGSQVDPNTIPGSLRFRNEGSSASYRLRLPSSAQSGLTPTNQQLFTLSVWLKDCKYRDNSAQGVIYGNHYRTSDSGYADIRTNDWDQPPQATIIGNGGTKKLDANKFLRDGTGWYHLVISCASNGTWNWYVNGELIQTQTGWGTPQWCPRNNDFQKIIGSGGNSSAQYWAGYRGNMAQFIYVDGTGYTPDKFGEFDDQGKWVCRSTDDIKSGISFGNCGYCLEFLDPAQLGKDTGPNGIHFTGVDNFNTTPGDYTYDLSEDSPSKNFAIMTPGFRGNNTPLVEWGGTKMASDGNWKGSISSHVIQPGSGTYYWEAQAGDSYVGIGDFTNDQAMRNLSNPALIVGWCAFRANGSNAYIDSTTISSVPQWNGQTAGFVLDTDAQTITLQTSSGNKTIDYSSSSLANKPLVIVYSTYGSVVYVNHGQQPWKRTPPASYRHVASYDLGHDNPITNPRDHFNVITYTGNGASSRSITGVGFEPAMVWIKDRTTGSQWLQMDTVRGGNSPIFTSSSSSAITNYSDGYISSFNSDGFTTQAGSSGSGAINASNINYVAYCWKGGSVVSNSDGTIQTTVCVNEEAGFSIVKYNGNGSSSATVGHGLSQAPKLIFLKNTSAGTNWYIYTTKEGTEDGFNARWETISGSATYQNGQVDPVGNDRIALGTTDGSINGSGQSYIMYCFHDVPGYQAIRFYRGNGSSMGVDRPLGFKPMFSGHKSSDGYSFMMKDSVREPWNARDSLLYLNSTSSETADTTSDRVDFTAVGTKMSSVGSNCNGSGPWYMNWAIADVPGDAANSSPTPAN